MADNAPNWTELLAAIFNNPEKGALFLVLIAGSWRWLREIWRESKDNSHHETLLETLMRENKDLRSENRELRKELHRKDHDNL